MQENSKGAMLWDFMLAVYARPGVASACLRLQEAHGLDVPLFLAVLHAVGTGSRLDQSAVAVLERGCAKWRQEVIVPLRRVRSRMKSADLLLLDPAVPALRAKIKVQELQAERIMVDVLAVLLSQWPGGAAESDTALVQRLREVGAFVLDLADKNRALRFPADAETVVVESQTYIREKRAEVLRAPET